MRKYDEVQALLKELRECSSDEAYLSRQAADEIARLTAENEKLRAALEPLACTCDRPNGAACSRSEVDCPFWNARAALEGK